ncbi:Tigger transposable element-derived protein 6 [Entomortierella beljakovae]|nr:Tigger transposable element-derived protein 6 [Entomortierella beljakovae]
MFLRQHPQSYLKHNLQSGKLFNEHWVHVGITNVISPVGEDSVEKRLPVTVNKRLPVKVNKHLPVKVNKRSPVTVQRKIEIIKYQMEHRTKSHGELAKAFNVPRTTLIGILKNQKSTLQYANDSKAKDSAQGVSIENTRRIVDSRSPTVESALVFWLNGLSNRGVTVSDKKICTQAIEIHRLLSTITNTETSVCHYTTGWLKGFKARHHLETERQYSDTLDYSWETKVISWRLYEYDSNDIYTCGLTSIFLTVMPASNTKDDMMVPSDVDCSSASVLLSCNASGSHKLEPFVVFRNPSIDSVSRSNVGEFNGFFFIEWLSELDANISRSILLLVDTDIWSYAAQVLNTDLRLQFVKVVSVPNSLRPHLPMNTKLLKEFKAQYHAQMFYVAPNMLAAPIGSHKPQLSLISRAWSFISDAMINRYFREFLEKGGLIQYHSRIYFQQAKSKGESGKERLKQALNVMLRPEDAIDRYLYYTAQDGDTGPSGDILTFLQRFTHTQHSSNITQHTTTKPFHYPFT